MIALIIGSICFKYLCEQWTSSGLNWVSKPVSETRQDSQQSVSLFYDKVSLNIHLERFVWQTFTRPGENVNGVLQ